MRARFPFLSAACLALFSVLLTPSHALRTARQKKDRNLTEETETGETSLCPPDLSSFAEGAEKDKEAWTRYTSLVQEEEGEAMSADTAQTKGWPLRIGAGGQQPGGSTSVWFLSKKEMTLAMGGIDRETCAKAGNKEAEAELRKEGYRCSSHDDTNVKSASQVIIDGRTPVGGSHHQKAVVFSHKGVLTAFIGGLDVTVARWDTYEHVIKPLCFKVEGVDPEADAAGSKFCGDFTPLCVWANHHCRKAGKETMKECSELEGVCGSTIEMCNLSKQPISIYKAVLKAVHRARNYIIVEDQYGIFVQHLFDALAAALYRGVRVRIYAMNQHSKSADTLIHSKTVLVDDRWLLVGSANINARMLGSVSVLARSPSEVSGQSEEQKTITRVCTVLSVSPISPSVFSDGFWSDFTLVGAEEMLVQALSTVHDAERIPLRILVDTEVCEKNDFKDLIANSEGFFGFPVRVYPETTFRADSASSDSHTRQILTICDRAKSSLKAIRAFAPFVIKRKEKEGFNTFLRWQQQNSSNRNNTNTHTNTGGTNSRLSSLDASEERAGAAASIPDYPLTLPPSPDEGTITDTLSQYPHPASQQGASFPSASNHHLSPVTPSTTNPSHQSPNSLPTLPPGHTSAHGITIGPLVPVSNQRGPGGNGSAPLLGASPGALAELKHMQTIWIPAHNVPRLIGAEGSFIQEFQNRSGAKIKYSNNTNMTGMKNATVTGTVRQVGTCVTLIRNKLDSWAALDNAGPHTHTLWVPDSLVSQVIGRKGTKIQEFQLYSGAAVFIDSPEQAVMGTFAQVCNSLGMTSPAHQRNIAEQLYVIQPPPGAHGMPTPAELSPQMPTLCRRMIVAGTQQAVSTCVGYMIEWIARALRGTAHRISSASAASAPGGGGGRRGHRGGAGGQAPSHQTQQQQQQMTVTMTTHASQIQGGHGGFQGHIGGYPHAHTLTTSPVGTNAAPPPYHDGIAAAGVHGGGWTFGSGPGVQGWGVGAQVQQGGSGMPPPVGPPPHPPNALPGPHQGTTEPSKPVTLLVIQSDAYDWPTIFGERKLSNGRPVKVVQTGWHEVFAQADNYSANPILVTVRRETGGLREGGSSPQRLMIKPDFLLIRNEVRELNDYRSLLYAFMFAGVPSVNSLESIFAFCERPVIQAALNALSRMCVQRGEAPLPLITQQFFPSHKEMMYAQPFPCVVKVGHAHAGLGKMKIRDHHDFADFRSVQAMTNTYCSAEPFVTSDFDLRIQKIGGSVRTFKRVGLSGDWKTNTGSSMMEEIETTEEYKRWVDEASKMFGGLDILTVDALKESASGKEVILEVNGTSSGLHPEYAAEDNAQIRDLVLGRLEELLGRVTD
uniref:PLD phosphodiesterase domain-containing protein n=1 Tax=Chromera velia CCMP2878 TaxID=1169474 RepID=A0A0G4ICT4_9ALVE|eukprot:Cvel_13136.t1-p1 / transcript=Cvel_13136.t1 / gene=Cvel_13136 / organism=Chromera_velia_CCMP2878 / gene_product=Synapsin-2, putative / transcript_product=Synapsin-2, putative / location=Cvel_scaffold886:15721-41581(+) / protein_length=1341 / sequence_SO=supercontig / SO=protein_coding / is_pseudo=false